MSLRLSGSRSQSTKLWETCCKTFSNLAAFELYDLLPTIKTAQATDTLATDVNKKIVDIPIVGYADLTER